MVSHSAESCPWQEWKELLVACHDYAVLSGWRFVLADFMNLSQRRHEADGLNAAREHAMPTALDFGDRVRACSEACKTGAAPTRLVDEFKACQRLVSSEAVYNSMVATIAAIGLGPGSGEVKDDDEALAYQDMTQPIEVIARRLNAYHRRVRDSAGMFEERQARLLHASFIVEFGLEHGLPETRDATSEATLTEFMSRLGEWEGARRVGGDETGEFVRSIVMESLPDGAAKRSLSKVVLDWVADNKALVIGGGLIMGTLIGAVVAGAAIAAASRSGAGTRGR